MRPVYLEFCGINSFSEPAKIDFASLLEFGLFGIFGDTGSGKSTILDCIAFALYGSISRSRTGVLADAINDRSDKAYVIFEFEITFEGKRRRFRAERELKRKSGGQTARVYERKGEDLAAVAEGTRECNACLERIIGLEQKDFEKCIALPQGEFAQFVKAARSDRLKLVSRLFGLEEYGEQLVKRANANCARLSEARNILLAKAEAFSPFSEEGRDALAAEIADLGKAEEGSRAALSEARREAERLAALGKLRAETERAARRMEELGAEREEIERLARELGRLAHAQAAGAAEQERRDAENALAPARLAERAAEEGHRQAEERLKSASLFDEAKADEEIARLTDLRARAKQSEAVRKKRAEVEEKLRSARAAYAEESKLFRDFSYQEEKNAIESGLAALGEGDFASFAETNGRAALLRTEYAAFAAELGAIGEKYPETAADIAPLEAKYRKLAEGDKVSFGELRAAYEARERSREALRGRLVDLERRNGLYAAHLAKLSSLQSEGLRLREELARMDEMTEEIDLVETERALEARTHEKRERSEAHRRAEEELRRSSAARAAAEQKRRAAEESLKRAETRLSEALARGGFGSAEEAVSLAAASGDAAHAEERVRKYREEVAALSAKLAEGEGYDLSEGSAEAVEAARTKAKELESGLEEIVRTLALRRDELARTEEALGKKRALEAELKQAVERAETAERLKKLLEGNKFMEFAAEEYLQNVAENGSRRLLSLTSGRYFLRYDGGFLVGDNLNGGNLRGVYTLSGGETFLVSLSLALALSAEICRKSLRPIEFFFLDEGFGTLDEHLVDVVMDSLEKLRGEHFSIGIISHVEELKHRIDRKLTVEKATEKHGSRIHA